MSSSSCTRASEVTAAKTANPETPNSKAYSKTLLLPQTKFPMRAEAAKRDHLFRDRTTNELYDWQWAQKDRPLYILQDGPPFANGNLHIGHALNKILKDIVIRYKVLRGYRVLFIPGWDCHGLPIEHKALQQLQTDHRELSPMDIRRLARKLAQKAIKTQMAEFKDFAIMANWDKTYQTFDKEYELRQLRVFQIMVQKGLIYRASKPVLWSPSSRTALAEAEVDYNENHVSESAFVKFPLKRHTAELTNLLIRNGLAQDTRVSLAIWTTTPWTLPANMFVAYGTDIEYVLATVGQSGDALILARARLEPLSNTINASLRVVFVIPTSVLRTLTYQAPFHVEADMPVIPADYVTADSGTGLVHCAAAHGVEDYKAFRNHLSGANSDQTAFPIISPVDVDGLFGDDPTGRILPEVLEKLRGKHVMNDGSLEILTMLRNSSQLLGTMKIRHKYAYDWRTKQPTIFRTTPQWFANLDKIKDGAISALQDVHFVPAQGRNRLEAFVKARSEWCFSRQRAWGVPIPALYDDTTAEAIMDTDSIEHIVDVLREKGVDHWWTGPIEDFLPRYLRDSGRTYRKGIDTMDVWFDSGTSWTGTVEMSENEGYRDRIPTADVYVEGSDQHRGWFQSSLLTSVAVSGNAPYASIVTHGFALDGKGVKMSKSIGNVVSPLEIVHGGKDKAKEPAYGADVLRFWAASSAYTGDVHISNNIIANASEGLRKIRNTVRFLLGNLSSASTVRQNIPQDSLSIIDSAILHEIADLEEAARRAYDDFAFSRAMAAVSHFCSSTLSSFYFEIVKDTLFNDKVSSHKRAAVIAVMRRALSVICSIMAPVAPHLVEDAWQHLQNSRGLQPSSFFREGWAEMDSSYTESEVHKDVIKLRNVRDVIMSLLETARSEKLIGSPAEAEIHVTYKHASDPLPVLLQANPSILRDVFMVSRVTLSERSLDDSSQPSWRKEATHHSPDGSLHLSVQPVSGTLKCPRCWLHTRQPEEELCVRCQDVLSA